MTKSKQARCFWTRPI